MLKWEAGATIPEWLLKEVYLIRVLEINGDEVLEITEDPNCDSYLVYPGDRIRLLSWTRPEDDG